MCILGVCAAFLPTTASAGPMANSRYVPLQEQSQGHSLVGANLLNDSLFSNPASSAFINVYSVDATFTGPRNFSASVLDTRTSQIGGAIGYSRQPTNYQDDIAQTFNAALTMRVLPYLGFGVGGRVLWAPDMAGNDARHTDLNVGAMLSMDPVQIGVSTQSVLGGDTNVADYRQTTLGGRIHYDQTLFLSAAATTGHNNFVPEQYGIGAEYVSPYRFALKGGYRIRPNENRSYWSAGFSILSPKISLHYAAVFPRLDDEAIQHMIGATVLF